VADSAPVDKSVTVRITELEKKLGTGPTYGARERALILEGVVPEWLFRARVMLKDADKAWADKLISGLTQAREQLWPKVRLSEFETTPPVAAKQPGDGH